MYIHPLIHFLLQMGKRNSDEQSVNVLDILKLITCLTSSFSTYYNIEYKGVTVQGSKFKVLVTPHRVLRAHANLTLHEHFCAHNSWKDEKLMDTYPVRPSLHASNRSLF